MKAPALGTLRCGVGRADMTPPAGIPHANWGAAKHEVAAGVDHPLVLTALYLDDGSPEGSALWVDFDLMAVMPEQDKPWRSAAAEASGVPPGRIFLSGTHTHSGPSVGLYSWVQAGRDLVAPYVAAVQQAVAKAAQHAKRTARDAHVGWGRGTCAININRRQVLPDGRVVVGGNPDGKVDREFRVLRFDDAKGEPIAAVLQYACHPTIMAHENDKITPDYPGIARALLEKELGGHALFLQGATGNVGPIEGFTGDLSVYRRAGTQLGAAALSVAAGIRTRPGELAFKEVVPSGADLGVFRWTEGEEKPLRVRVLRKELRLPAAKPQEIAPLKAEADRLGAEFQQAVQRGDGPAIRAAGMRAKRALIQVRRAERIGDGSPLPVPVGALALGSECAIFSAPLELFAETGFALKDGSPFEAFFLAGYTDGYRGYLPTDDALSVGGYEVETTPYGPGAAAAFDRGALDVLKELKAKVG